MFFFIMSINRSGKHNIDTRKLHILYNIVRARTKDTRGGHLEITQQFLYLLIQAWWIRLKTYSYLQYDSVSHQVKYW